MLQVLLETRPEIYHVDSVFECTLQYLLRPNHCLPLQRKLEIVLFLVDTTVQ